MVRKSDLYKVDGDKIERKNQICPRCGEGVFMADHGDRFACGNCGYTEMKKIRFFKSSFLFLFIFIFNILFRRDFIG